MRRLLEATEKVHRRASLKRRLLISNKLFVITLQISSELMSSWYDNFFFVRTLNKIGRHFGRYWQLPFTIRRRWWGREGDGPRTDRRCPEVEYGLSGLVYGRVATAVVLTWGGVMGNQAVEVHSALFLPGSGNRLFHGSSSAGRSAILRIFGRGKKRKNSFPINFFYWPFCLCISVILIPLPIAVSCWLNNNYDSARAFANIAVVPPNQPRPILR